MKRAFVLLIAVLMVFGLTACGGGFIGGGDDGSMAEATSGSSYEDDEDLLTDSDVLVVYFSATGTTEGVAERIASVTDADLYEIEAAQEYTSEDLDYNNSESRAAIEQNDPDARPEIGSHPVSIEEYNTVYIGYPIWFGQEPRIMDTFVESYDFEGITVIPFCTSGSSDIGSSGQNLAENAGSGNWLDGKRFEGDVSEEDLQAWIDGLE